MKNNIIIIFFTLVALSIVCNGTAERIVINTPPTIHHLEISSDRILTPESDDGIEIKNITGKLDYWNVRLGWDLSQEQIHQYSHQKGDIILNNFTTFDGKWFHVKNLTKFDEELGKTIGLNNDQISQFILEDKKQLEIDRQNYDKYNMQKSNPLSNSSLSESAL